MKNKILLVGFGRWGKIWYNNIIVYDKDLIVGIVDPEGTELNINIPCFRDINDVNIEFTHAIVAVPASLQLHVFNKLKQKIDSHNILVEKPVGLSSANSFKDVVPGFVFLHDNIYKYIKQNIKNDLGKIFSYKSIRASMGPTIRKDCSIIEDYLIHDLYLYIDLFSSSNYPIGWIPRVYFVDDQCDFEDYSYSGINIIGGISNGPKFNMESSWWYPEKTRKVIIIGDKGSYVWDNDKLFYYKSYYRKIDGKDKYNNNGYELVENDVNEILIDREHPTLINELVSFLDNKRNYNILLDKTKKLINIIEFEI